MRKKCIKFLICFIILALSCVLYSDDTNALTLSLSIEPTGNAWQEMQVDCIYSIDANNWRASNTGNSQWSCNNFPSNAGNNPSLQGIRTHNTIHVEEGLYYQGFFILRNPNSGASGAPAIYWNFNQSDDFDFVTIEELYADKLYESIYFNTQCVSGVCDSGNSSDEIYNKIYVVTLKAKTTGDVKYQFGTPTSQLVKAIYPTYVFGLRKIVEFKPSSIEAALDEQNQKDDEDRSNLESQSESTDSDSADSAEDATEAGTTLLGAFSAFVSALTSATPSDCELDMDLGNLDMGNVDLCELDPPSGFSALASVFLILFCVPLSIATARKVINLFRSFQ